MQVIRPFGPSIGKTTMPKEIIDELNRYVDEIVVDEERSKKLDHGKHLAGNVTQEFVLEKEFMTSSGWKNFLKNSSEEWISKSTKAKELKKFQIIDSWIVRQFENEYNPLHSHTGHISGVGYLKVPENYGKTTQDEKRENYNGCLQLIHGSKMFLSPVSINITPKVGDFYFFPHYLMHCVYPFKNSNAERRSISFNANIDENVFAGFAS